MCIVSCLKKKGKNQDSLGKCFLVFHVEVSYMGHLFVVVLVFGGLITFAIQGINIVLVIKSRLKQSYSTVQKS